VAGFCFGAGARVSDTWRLPDVGEIGRTCWQAKWELLLPVIVIAGLFGGFVTVVETGAITVLYALVIKCMIDRDVSPGRDLPRIFRESIVVVGGVLMILRDSLGCTSSAI